MDKEKEKLIKKLARKNLKAWLSLRPNREENHSLNKAEMVVIWLSVFLAFGSGFGASELRHSKQCKKTIDVMNKSE